MTTRPVATSIGARIVLATLIATGCVVWLAASGIQATQTLLMQEKRLATRHLVETAHAVLAHFAALASSGRLTEPQAQQAALAAVRALRYDEREYFWINDMHPRMLMHPIRPELDGKDLTDNKDPTGKRLFVEFVETVRRSKEGFVDYQWPKPGQTEPVAKISYVKGFEPWGWVIGSGIYIDDVNAAVWARVRAQGLVVIALAIGSVIGGWLLRRSIARPIAAAVEVAQAIAGGKLDNAIMARGPSEVRRLLGALESMQSGLRVRIEADRTRLVKNERIRQALDAASVPVRIVDNEGTILFFNRALRRKLAQLEPEIRKRIPGFDKDRMLGASIGMFYPDPQQALARLRQLDRERRSVLEIGGRHFDIVTNPIIDEHGERLGTVGEWIDRHDEIRAERRLAELIEAAARGDFSGRVDLAGLDGFHRIAATGINQLMEEVSKSLEALGRGLAALARGELDQQMGGPYQGLFAKLQSDMNGTLARLALTVTEIRAAADAVTIAAHEIAQGNADLSGRTEAQASSLEQTASSMEQLTATVAQTADHAVQAKRLAAEASDLAGEGGATVKRVVTTMAQIGGASQRVREIIGTIDAIAFQTNILALNATVEAARAGEQGRGFAVVAAQVRQLAQNSAAAAAEIRELIGNATTRVEAGSALVTTAGEQMERIVQAVARVTDIVSQIASAAGEQSIGIAQISTAVAQMDEMTQRNAALVEQAAAASESLEEQSVKLGAAIGVFKLSRAARTPRTVQPQAA